MTTLKRTVCWSGCVGVMVFLLGGCERLSCAESTAPEYEVRVGYAFDEKNYAAGRPRNDDLRSWGIWDGQKVKTHQN